MQLLTAARSGSYGRAMRILSPRLPHCSVPCTSQGLRANGLSTITTTTTITTGSGWSVVRS